jgi:hypothetical protein
MKKLTVLLFIAFWIFPALSRATDYTDTDQVYGWNTGTSAQFWQTWADHKTQLDTATYTGTLLGAITSTKTAVQTLATELDNAVEINASSVLVTALSDETGSASGTPLAVFNQNPTIAGATLTGAIDAGGATSVEIPNGNDVNVDAVGEMSYDTNGNWLRMYDGTNQVAVAQKQVCYDATVYKPNDLTDAARDATRLFQNKSGMNFIVTSWEAQSSTDNTDLNIETTTNSGGTNATVDAVSITTDGTSMFYASDSTITAGTIATGSIVWLDFDDTDTPDWVSITVCGYFDGYVN